MELVWIQKVVPEAALQRVPASKRIIVGWILYEMAISSLCCVPPILFPHMARLYFARWVTGVLVFTRVMISVHGFLGTWTRRNGMCRWYLRALVLQVMTLLVFLSVIATLTCHCEGRVRATEVREVGSSKQCDALADFGRWASGISFVNFIPPKDWKPSKDEKGVLRRSKPTLRFDGHQPKLDDETLNLLKARHKLKDFEKMKREKDFSSSQLQEIEQLWGIVDPDDQGWVDHNILQSVLVELGFGHGKEINYPMNELAKVSIRIKQCTTEYAYKEGVRVRAEKSHCCLRKWHANSSYVDKDEFWAWFKWMVGYMSEDEWHTWTHTEVRIDRCENQILDGRNCAGSAPGLDIGDYVEVLRSSRTPLFVGDIVTFTPPQDKKKKSLAERTSKANLKVNGTIMKMVWSKPRCDYFKIRTLEEPSTDHWVHFDPENKPFIVKNGIEHSCFSNYMNCAQTAEWFHHNLIKCSEDLQELYKKALSEGTCPKHVQSSFLEESMGDVLVSSFLTLEDIGSQAQASNSSFKEFLVSRFARRSLEEVLVSHFFRGLDKAKPRVEALDSNDSDAAHELSVVSSGLEDTNLRVEALDSDDSDAAQEVSLLSSGEHASSSIHVDFLEKVVGKYHAACLLAPCHKPFVDCSSLVDVKGLCENGKPKEVEAHSTCKKETGDKYEWCFARKNGACHQVMEDPVMPANTVFNELHEPLFMSTSRCAYNDKTQMGLRQKAERTCYTFKHLTCALLSVTSVMTILMILVMYKFLQQSCCDWRGTVREDFNIEKDLDIEALLAEEDGFSGDESEIKKSLHKRSKQIKAGAQKSAGKRSKECTETASDKDDSAIEDDSRTKKEKRAKQIELEQSESSDGENVFQDDADLREPEFLGSKDGSGDEGDDFDVASDSGGKKESGKKKEKKKAKK